MTCCCAVGCSNQQGKGKKLFRVPLGERNKKRRKIWMSRIKRKNFTCTPATRLCEDHFTIDQFEPHILAKTGEKKLKPDAVPSLFAYNSPSIPRRLPSRRNQETCAEASTSVQQIQAFEDAQDTILPDNEQCHMSVEACPAAAQDTILPDNGQCHVFVEASTAAANTTLPGVEQRHAFVKAGTAVAPSVQAALNKRIVQLE
ncbi:THAP domain-containing protein 1 isoform X1 [Ixodes scapularis]|uniref:THAP domain-containing protein 1 isoform X1 n=1 Tax=Ixodes scapularis TaxID=6945 RepID=UPI001C38C56C|nr:THAP domain-containing protein 1 isoform X1 [Ixodes scapularis]